MPNPFINHRPSPLQCPCNIPLNIPLYYDTMSGPPSPFSAEEFYCVKTLRNSQHTQTGRLSVEVITHIMRVVCVRVCMEKSLHLKPSEFREHLEEITDSAVKNACETVKTPSNANYDEFYESKCAETKAIETWP